MKADLLESAQARLEDSPFWTGGPSAAESLVRDLFLLYKKGDAPPVKKKRRKDESTAVQHRGITLPAGMSPELADALEHKLCVWHDEPDEFPLEFGVRIFQEISETLASSSPAS